MKLSFTTFSLFIPFQFEGGTKRAAVAVLLPGNFSEKPSWQEFSLRTINARKFGVDQSGNI
jgi:hypothetical protein